MTDERNIAHDKKVAQEKKHQGENQFGQAASVPQPGKKPHQIDTHTAPSNSVAKDLYKHGEEPRVRRDGKKDEQSGEEGKA